MAVNAIAAVVTYLQTTAGALSGMGSAPTDPTSSVNAFPAAITFPADITMGDTLTKGDLIRLVTLHTLIFKSAQSLPQDVALLMPYGDSFPAAVFTDPTLGGTVQTIAAPMTAKFGALTYNGDATYIGWTFITTVKLENLL